MNQNEVYIINLALDYSKGELSAEKRAELIQIMNDPESKKIFVRYYKTYKKTRSVAFINQVNEGDAWNKINSRIRKSIPISRKSKLNRFKSWIPYAAAIAIFAIVGTYLVQRSIKNIDYTANYNFEELVDVDRGKAFLKMANGSVVNLEKNKELELSELDGTKIYKDSTNSISYETDNTETVERKQSKILYNTVVVPKGGEYQLILIDGTVVFLNADSELRFPIQFANDKREVFLKGEAYFDVAQNKNAPFTVYAHDTEVKALGTKFNISAYNDQEYIATTLVEGSVRVNNLGNSTVLEPAYQSMVIRGRSAIDVKAVDTKLYTSWIDGVYEFENTELEYIMTQLNRWYNVKFFFEEAQYKNIRFTGAVKRDNSFEYTLQLISRVADVDFAIKDDYVVVRKKTK
ncbi:FecR family protein [Marinifilum sp.]|uniref:FecR family protein n=1 Tax=Marinifilum sp. TaxID=2033137 RepID=UPI003BAC25F7